MDDHIIQTEIHAGIKAKTGASKPYNTKNTSNAMRYKGKILSALFYKIPGYRG